jgi:putative effector of murein hydrolase LrgA (UPF0299 family)
VIQSIALLLTFQLAGEVAVRAAALPVPGPVLGMALLLAAFALRPALVEAVAPTARGLLAHLSLLFVPAGVGVVGHLDRMGTDGAAILTAIVASTALAMLAAAAAFLAVARLTGGGDA